MRLQKELNWEIKESDIYTSFGNKLEGYKSITNNQTDEVIAIHKKSYQPAKNERLMEIANNFCDNTDFNILGYETFNGGSKVMAYLENGSPQLFGGQKTTDYLVLGNSHDGSTSFFTGMTNQIHRCTNMFTHKHRQNRVRHTRSLSDELEMIERTHDLYFNELTGVYSTAERMQEIGVDRDKREIFAKFVLNESKDLNEMSTRGRNTRQKLMLSIERETADLGNNLFGLFNGVTHYTSNVMKSKNKTFGNMFNTANTLNQRAYEWCKKETEPKVYIPILPLGEEELTRI